MYKKIYVALDNSPFSEACSTAAVSLARAFGAQVIGSHVYAARMHERRFRQMESTLPEEYLEDKELERQRTIHESLISLGLQLISDCYLDALERLCKETEVPFSRKTFDGKNWERLVEDINSSDYDLVVMGARGHGTSRTDSVGSVCLRVLRRTRTDTLVIKDLEAFQNGAGKPILVGLDGSQESFGALQAALALGRVYNRPVEAVAAYDPYFHYAVFNSMVSVLSTEATRLFRLREQERLHEEIIDTGLARLYQTHLEIAKRLAAAEGVALSTTLLVGRAADQVLSYAEKAQPWLLLLGRIGVHSRGDMDIGSVTEHLLHSASCNLLIASRRYDPPLDVWGQTALRWTDEAETLLQRAPQEYRGAVRLMVHRLSLERGHTVVTTSLVGEAMESLRPQREEMQEMREMAASVAVETLRKETDTLYLCPGCGHATRGRRPVTCPGCGKDGHAFSTVEMDALEAAAKSQGGIEENQTFDGTRLRWSGSALGSLRQIHDRYERNRARLRIEKAARRARIPVITLEFVMSQMKDSPEAKPPTEPVNRS